MFTLEAGFFHQLVEPIAMIEAEFAGAVEVVALGDGIEGEGVFVEVVGDPGSGVAGEAGEVEGVEGGECDGFGFGEVVSGHGFSSLLVGWVPSAASVSSNSSECPFR